jgi:hypothetical protein
MDPGNVMWSFLSRLYYQTKKKEMNLFSAGQCTITHHSELCGLLLVLLLIEE